MTETFQIIPASPKVLYLISCLLLLLLMLVILSLLAASITWARNSRFELSDEGLRIRHDQFSSGVVVVSGENPLPVSGRARFPEYSCCGDRVPWVARQLCARRDQARRKT